MKTPYETLGVDPKATTDTAKKAFRAKAKKAHSDKGGDDATMRELNRAWAIVGNPTRRQRYDETDDTGERTDNEAEMALAQMFFTVMNGRDPDTNLVVAMRDELRANQLRFEQDKRTLHQQEARARKVLERIVFRGEGQNLLASAAQSAIDEITTRRAALTHALDVAKAMLVLLEAYSYTVEKEQDDYLGARAMAAAVNGRIRFTF